MSKVIGRLIAGIVTILLGVWIKYLAMPAWTLRSVGMWGFILGMCIIAIVAFVVAEMIADYLNDCTFIVTGIVGVLAVIVLLVMIIGGFTSSYMFNASNYHNMVEIEKASFEEDIPKIAQESQVPIVDVGTAQKVGDRTVGGIKNATWYEVDDEYNLIKYQGKFYRISELNYGGFWKYRKAKNDGIPGYVLVDAMTQEAKYVELEKPIKYSPSAHFSQLLKRHLRNQYPSYIFGKSFFEIDEKGTPYYITSIKTPTIGLFGGKKENSFVITNAATGESKEYKMEELPEWVDHAYDLDYLMNIIKDNQKYVNGWWNSKFSKTGVNSTSYQYKDSDFAGYNTTITTNGEIAFYTGVSPVSNAESNLGFILANPRTGKINYYDCAGAEESSAQEAAESLVQNLGYYATFPTILNVDGSETYFMLLKDKAGLVQRYALCNVKDYTKVVQAESFENVLNLYKEKIGTKIVDKTSEEETLKKEGKIENLYQAQIDGCTYYYFTIEGNTELYMSSIKNSNKQVMLKVGTKVSIEYNNTSEEGIFLVKKIQF